MTIGWLVKPIRAFVLELECLKRCESHVNFCVEVCVVRKPDNDNDNDTLREVPHPSNEGLGRGHDPTKKNLFY